MYSLATDRPTRRNWSRLVNQGVSVIAVKTGDYRSDLLRWDLDAAAVTDTRYPPPRSLADAESAEDAAQHVVGGDGTDDGADGV